VRRLGQRARPRCTPLWTSRVSGYSFYEDDGESFLLASETGVFRVGRNEIGVGFDPFTAEARNYLLGAGIALWLELNGLPVLHAACVATGRDAVGLLGHSTAGKSTLAAGLVTAGWRFVSDDLLPLDVRDGGFEIYPSKPSTRLWPDAARHFAGDPALLARVAATTEKRVVSASALGGRPVPSEPYRLRALYVLERTRNATEVAIRPLGARDALLSLLALSFAGEIVEGLSLRASRLQSLARAAREIPVRCLCYPSGFERVSEACESLAADFRGLAR
jgi:hypothetical protein